jgi:hypothetical protein
MATHGYRHHTDCKPHTVKGLIKSLRCGVARGLPLKVGGIRVYFVLARNRKAKTERQIETRHGCFGRRSGEATRLALIWTLLFAPLSTPAQGPTSTEYRIKASFLTAVPSFIDWPETAFASATAPLLVCVLGDFRFGTALMESARTTSPHARHIDVRWMRKHEELKNCHLLFVSNSETKRYAQILKIVRGTGVLTIGETPDFLGVGGMLSFSFQNDLLKFEVNLAAVNEAHLRASSKLLALARRVVNERVHRRDVKTRKWIQIVCLPADSLGTYKDTRFVDRFPRRWDFRKFHGDSERACGRKPH